LTRPVRSSHLLNSPEMALRHPGELEISRFGVDEGAGRAFDNADPSASAERDIWVTGDIDEFLEWYEQRLGGLGWHRTRLPPEMRHPNSLSMSRRRGEHFGVDVRVYPPDQRVLQPGERAAGHVSYLVEAVAETLPAE
jgi:hypothetical protein